eukprot:CAMPEP_0115416256 /NCGR_PEP_ID=MMETSP0271-20121206/23522_1 /TAXON_ID=71861 /ORGANISM="Scrippsiella trochoidea, Strain CCMP3099" /LENGTH=302 /DNA_ID=CAMNT_0002840621 /DNA_START=17 /DNA_END=925 /DNA_ORIENTATION=-
MAQFRMVGVCQRVLIYFLTISAARAHLRGNNVSAFAEWNHVIAVNESCYGTVEGDTCHAAIVWVMKHGVVSQPECYPNLYQGSSWPEFQLHLHGNPQMMRAGNCEEPVHTCQKTQPGDGCYEEVKRFMENNITKLPGGKEWTIGDSFWDIQMLMHVSGVAGHIGGCYNPCPGCHTALPSETCYAKVVWAMEEDIDTHPERYCGLDSNSSFLDFQKCLHEQKAHGCPMPCRKCAAPVEGDSCHKAVTWLMKYGLNINPDGYPTLTPQASFEEIQEFLHSTGYHQHQAGFTPCPEPCRNYSWAP